MADYKFVKEVHLGGIHECETCPGCDAEYFYRVWEISDKPNVYLVEKYEHIFGDSEPDYIDSKEVSKEEVKKWLE